MGFWINHRKLFYTSGFWKIRILRSIEFHKVLFLKHVLQFLFTALFRISLNVRKIWIDQFNNWSINENTSILTYDFCKFGSSRRSLYFHSKNNFKINKWKLIIPWFLIGIKNATGEERSSQGPDCATNVAEVMNF